MTKTKTMRGTCPACFRTMDVDGGTMHKHGWSESGGRKAGEYGRAWHTGSCFGTGWAPFEVSPEGTWAYLSKLVFPHALGVSNVLARLATRPVLRIYWDYDTGESAGWGKGNVKERREGLLEPGKTIEVDAGDLYGRPRTRKFEYESELKSRIGREERELAATIRTGRELSELAANWKVGTLVEKKAKGPVVHKTHPRSGKYGARALCGSRSHYVTTSEVDTEVTCTRCCKTLATNRASREKSEGRKADGLELARWLGENGGAVASKVIKKALGWDTKRFNAALDYAPGVHGDWGKGTRKYMAKPAYDAYLAAM